MGRKFSKSLGRKTHGDPSSVISTLDEEEALNFLDDLKDPFLLILDQVQDPQLWCLSSFGRWCGVNLVVVPSDRSAGLTEVVRHVAAGAAESLAIARNLSRFMKRLKERGIHLVGTSDQAKHSIFSCSLKGPIALVVGAEGNGIRRLTAENCDELINIPMAGTIECLNVSVATGGCLFEIFRQRENLT